MFSLVYAYNLYLCMFISYCSLMNRVIPKLRSELNILILLCYILGGGGEAREDPRAALQEIGGPAGSGAATGPPGAGGWGMGGGSAGGAMRAG